jgi:hypothetical protein
VISGFPFATRRASIGAMLRIGWTVLLLSSGCDCHGWIVPEPSDGRDGSTLVADASGGSSADSGPRFPAGDAGDGDAGDAGDSGSCGGTPWDVAGAWTHERIDEVTNPGPVAVRTSMAVDAEGAVHLSYSNGDLRYATNASGAWVIEIVDPGPSGWSGTSLALGGDGTVRIAYHQGGGEDDEIRYASNASGAWSIETVGEGQQPDIALDEAGAAHLVYVGDWRIEHATNAAGDWRIETVSDEWDQMPSVAVGADGAVHAFADSAGGLHHFTKSAEGGEWSSETVVEDRSGFRDAAVDSCGRLHVAYENEDDERGLQYAVQEAGGGAWTVEPVKVFPSGHYVSLSLDAGNRAHIAFQAGLDGHVEYATNAGGDWRVEVVDPGEGSGNCIALGLGADAAWVAYYDIGDFAAGAERVNELRISRRDAVAK